MKVVRLHVCVSDTEQECDAVVLVRITVIISMSTWAGVGCHAMEGGGENSTGIGVLGFDLESQLCHFALGP
jgi:hypothetical protein